MNVRLPGVQPSTASPPAPAAVLRRKCACGGSGRDCEECRKKGTLQRKSAGGGGPELAPPIFHEVLLPPGQPLDAQARAFPEAQPGHDFSRVRVLADAGPARLGEWEDRRSNRQHRGMVSRSAQPFKALGSSDGGRSRPIQTRLAVNEPADPFEQEADRVAEEVMRMPASPTGPEGSARPAQPRVQRRVSAGGPGLAEAPPIVDDVLRSSGQAMDSSSQAFFEARFGHDFSQVRIHTDSRAAESVQAHAFTVGSDIVFAAGRYAPATLEGRRLLGHELTHVVQQGAGLASARNPVQGLVSRQPAPAAVQRRPAVPYKGVILPLDEIKKDPQREKLRKQSGQSQAKVCRSIGRDLDKENCPISLNENAVVTVTAEKVAGLWLQIDCAGIPGFGPLEQCHVLGAFVKPQPPPPDSTISGGSLKIPPSAGGSLKIPPSPAEIKEPSPPATPPAFVCGPNVTAALQEALKTVASKFEGLDTDQKQRSCQTVAQINQPIPLTAFSAWDIVELYHEHVPFWMPAYSGCGTKGADPPCDLSVQVEKDSHYAGSVNYVLFGKILNLCNGIAPKSYTKEWMLDLITLYKGPGLLSGPAANYEASKAWAEAGYDGWPSGAAAPPGDQQNCAPTCGDYVGGELTPRWAPYIGPDE